MITATHNYNRIETSSLEAERDKLSISATKLAYTIFEELGSSCAGTGENDDGEVQGGDSPYDTIDDVRSVMTLGDRLSRTCWGTNAKDNRSYYLSGTGHVVTVKPRDELNPNKDSVRRVEKFLEIWMKENDWSQRQTEVSHRLDRHGEVFDMLFYDTDEDGLLMVYFAEPTDLDDDADSKYTDTEDTDKAWIDILGVRRTNDLRYKATQYFIDGGWYRDLRASTKRGMLPDLESPELANSTLIQHRKRNCLANDARGLTLYWPVREELIWAKRLLSNMMRVSSFQAAFGAIRTVDAIHGADAVKSYLASTQTGTASGTSSSAAETFDFPSPSVVTKPSTVQYEFPETGRGTSNTVEVLVQLLRACSAGMKTPEFMLTANVSEGNFASTLVSEGPFHKGMSFEQSLMVTEDERILYQALQYAASKGIEGLTEEDIANIVLKTKPPRIQTRNREEDFKVNQQLYENGELSGKTLVTTEGFERESEQAQRVLEIKDQLPLPPVAVKTSPGPEPDPNVDPMKEKGVSKGNPSRIPAMNP